MYVSIDISLKYTYFIIMNFSQFTTVKWLFFIKCFFDNQIHYSSFIWWCGDIVLGFRSWVAKSRNLVFFLLSQVLRLSDWDTRHFAEMLLSLSILKLYVNFLHILNCSCQGMPIIILINYLFTNNSFLYK